MNFMKLNKLNLINFRHFNNVEIEFGNNLTIISGQNGTGKSSILGWIAQLFDYKQNNKRINGKSYTENFRNVFRFCPLNDYKNRYEVVFDMIHEGKNKQKKISTRYVASTERSPERYRTDVDGREKAIDFPMVYHGLKRLIPLATEARIQKSNIQFSAPQKKEFSKLSKEILILIDDKINPESITTQNKDILAMQTSNYSHLGNSAGQDNLGQLLGSLLSFDELRKNNNSYKGGIILIDEIDASLYAASQVKLIDTLYKYSKKLNLQIIFTTHSLHILEHLEKKLGDETKVNHLIIQNGKIHNKLNPTLQYVSQKIKNQLANKQKVKKKDVICEDRSAELWIKNLLNGTILKNKIYVEQGPLSDGELVNLASSKSKHFRNLGFILDGDSRSKLKDRRIPPRTAFLPGTEPPEVVLYKFIKSLPDDDSFWNDDENFTKQTCFGNYQSSSLNSVKRWFSDQKFSRYFGRGHSKLFNRWKRSNMGQANKFVDELSKAISDL